MDEFPLSCDTRVAAAIGRWRSSKEKSPLCVRIPVYGRAFAELPCDVYYLALLFTNIPSDQLLHLHSANKLPQSI